MISFLNGSFAPITLGFGFFEAKLRDISKALLNWRQEHSNEQEIRYLELDLSKGLSLLEPLTSLRRRELLVSTRSNWTAYFDNSLRGGDPTGTLSHLSLILKCRSLAIDCYPDIPDKGDGQRGCWGAVQFQLFSPEKKEFLNYERTVSVVNDGGKWEFNASGTVQPFENKEAYKSKRIKDRFTPEMLERYCSALGIEAFSKEFYTESSAFIQILDPLPSEHRKASIAEMQRDMGLKTQGNNT